MKREFEFDQRVERSILTTYRKELWKPFILAVKRYELIQEGDRVAVCISGGKDSMLLAKLMQELQRHSKVHFETAFLVMDPGYNERNRRKIEQNAALLNVPIQIFETDVFNVANSSEHNPCYLCARMRRGYLYSKAKELGCNKIALGHHFNDVIETTVMAMFYGAQLQAMLPKLHSSNFEGMELIRPMYCIHEEDIIRWKNAHGLEFIQCACRFTENCATSEDGSGNSKRQDIDRILIMRDQEDTYDSESLYALFTAIDATHIKAVRDALRAEQWHFMKPEERFLSFLHEYLPEEAFRAYDGLFSDFRMGGYRVSATSSVILTTPTDKRTKANCTTKTTRPK